MKAINWLYYSKAGLQYLELAQVAVETVMWLDDWIQIVLTRGFGILWYPVARGYQGQLAAKEGYNKT